MNKPKLLQIVLALGALYYLIGAIAHWWGLTIWPFYDSRLYTPYHDSVIALAAIILTGLLLIVARDPVKNMDILKVIIVASFTASLFSILIIYKVDFTALGAPDKAIQTVVEGILGFVFTGALIWLYPNK